MDIPAKIVKDIHEVHRLRPFDFAEEHWTRADLKAKARVLAWLYSYTPRPMEEFAVGDKVDIFFYGNRWLHDGRSVVGKTRQGNIVVYSNDGFLHVVPSNSLRPHVEGTM